MQDYSSNLDQASRLEFTPIASRLISLDEPECVTISSPPNGFIMPRIKAVSESDWLNANYSGDVDRAPMMDEESDEESSDEALASETVYKRRDSMREHSFRLPSQSSRRECLAEMRALGLAWND